MPYFWFIAALSASVLWGLGYVLCEYLLKNSNITPLFMACMTSLVTFPLFLALALYNKEFKPGIQALLSNTTLIPVLFLEAITIIGGTYLIYTAIESKNASLVSAIESTYPIFAMLFAFLILREVQVNMWSGAGIMLVMSGVLLITLKS
jgi:drug/metabolite transporter (DMT)-like permease